MQYINIKPYGRILQDRFNLAVKYKLLKQFDNLWLTTRKCNDNYSDFGMYLKGTINEPRKKSKDKYSYYNSETSKLEKQKTKQELIQEISLL